MSTCETAYLSAAYQDHGGKASLDLLLLFGWPDAGARRDRPDGAAKDVPAKFTGPFAMVPFEGVGHFPRREAPAAAARVLAHHFAGGDPADLSAQTKE